MPENLQGVVAGNSEDSHLNNDQKDQSSSNGELEHLNPQEAGARLAERSLNALSAPTSKHAPIPFSRYRELFKQIVQKYRNANEENLTTSYAAEWILDNDYLIFQTIRQVEENLPVQFLRQLPRLNGMSQPQTADVWRIFVIAHEIIRLENAHLQPEWMNLFLAAYQEKDPLTMGELWALPAMLRLGILQALAQSAARLIDFEGDSVGLEYLPNSWNGQITDDEIVANCFISLRTLSAQNWKDFFEEQSLVERILNLDPSGDYPHLDFETRDRYRKVVESIARATGVNEGQVAETAVDLSRGKQGRQAHVGFYLLSGGRRELEAHFTLRLSVWQRLKRWILDHPTLLYLGSISLISLLLLIFLVNYSVKSGGSVWQFILAALLGIVPAITISVGLVNWIISQTLSPQVLPKMDFSDGIPKECASIVVVPALLNSEEMISSLLDQLELHYLRNPDPMLTFALLSDFPDSIEPHLPSDARLLETARAGIKRLNRKYSRSHNRRRRGAPFMLIHRERRYNPREGYWMGWERKRGKLRELNGLILGTNPIQPGRLASADEEEKPEEARLEVLEGDPERLKGVRYVITLDADTILPPEGARRLIGTLAHPLNRAEFNEHGRITAGYSILQPRTEILPTSAVKSTFTRIYSGDIGLDLYSLAVSDVYQDLFGEGSYIGKGIYDIAAFETSLEGRVPENALLSHDLFEGIHGRAGLVSDITLIEDYPSNYLSHIHRLHRWTRGDWQLLPWLFPSVPAEDGKKWPNPLSMISRWKIFDNLRRSLLSPALLALFTAAWTGLLPGSQGFWLLVGLVTLAAPLLTGLFSGLLGASRSKFIGGALLETANSLWVNILRWLMALAFLPFEALFALDAIAITLIRLYFTHRGLLQWTTAAEAEKLYNGRHQRWRTWLEMASSPLVSGILAALMIGFNPNALFIAAPFLVVWLAAPEIAYQISLPLRKAGAPLEEQERAGLRLLARQTWLFFEQYVGPEDHWLPPDHFQEYPLGIVAHRSSPTNIGLYLLVALGAYDLGYTGLLGLAARLRSSFDSLAELERHRGHFLNWYDTRTLTTLLPHYVSTVDSGNLAACLLALQQGLLSLEDAPVLRWETFEGLLDSLSLLRSSVENLETGEVDSQAVNKLIEVIDQLRADILEVKDFPDQWAALLFHLAAAPRSTENLIPRDLASYPRLDLPTQPTAQRSMTWDDMNRWLLEVIEVGGSQEEAENLRRLRIYSRQARQRLDNANRELDVLHPWLRLLAAPPVQLQRGEVRREVVQAWKKLDLTLSTRPKLSEAANMLEEANVQLNELRQALESETDHEVSAVLQWATELEKAMESGLLAIKALMLGFLELANEAETYFQEMDFRFLFDKKRQVFHIGYNLALGRLENNYYDLLASEARIASLIAIAKRDVDPVHWLHLARPITQLYGERVLLSWSATMFEYLMPSLLIRGYPGSLLHQSAQAAVEIHIKYGRERGTPWGISESGYYRFDQAQTYQYRAFGVPGLGYKRDLEDDLVIAPYASLLALPFRPKAVLQNLTRLEDLGGRGIFGLYEALDFTPARLSAMKRYAVVREYMAHHQGMIFLSILNVLNDDLMVKRLHNDARIQSIDLLLQEQVPEQAPLEEPHAQGERAIRSEEPQIDMTPWRAHVRTLAPTVHFLSNGHYGVLITASGAGYSIYQDTALTRWRADPTLDEWGTWIYVQDLDSRRLWSASYLPTAVEPDNLDVYFSPHMAAMLRKDGDITTALEITVAPDANVEIRRLTLTNHSEHPKRLRLTSYAEVILAPQKADQRHPTFNKLFIESEWLPESGVLLFKRRPRSDKEEKVFLAHMVSAGPDLPLTGAFESDRRCFIGRGGSLRAPQALSDGGWLSGTAGATLDPIMAIGQEISLAPHSTAQFAYITLVATRRREALELAARFSAWGTVERAFQGAHSAAEIELQQLGLESPQIQRIQRLLSACLYPQDGLRAPAETIIKNTRGQPSLWAYAISGDFPIILASLEGIESIPMVQELLQAHAYWRSRGLKIDLVLLNEQGASYGGELTGQLYRLLNRSGGDAWLNQRGGIFILMADAINPEDRILLETAARVILDSKKGTLAEQLPEAVILPSRLPSFVPSLPDGRDPEQTPTIERPGGLLFDNGLAGFSPDGREYLIFLEYGRHTPAPWVNVIANPDFGCLVSESALGYTWAINSGENRLTPWSNDPVSDPAGEALYLRDEETGNVWSPTPIPSGVAVPYLVRHGAGYTIFEHNSHGLNQTLQVFVAPDDPVKIIRLRLKNLWRRQRRITVTYYVEWVLGVNPEDMQPFIIPEFEAETQALLARNPYNIEFNEHVAFTAANKELHGLTADRTEFLGRMGDRHQPAALTRIGLSGTVQAGLDPCAALQLHVDLGPGEEEEVYFLLGQGEDREEALALVKEYRQAQAVSRAWEEMGERWENLLGTIQVRTPEPAMDLLLNRWLLYQTLACRIWGRSGFYQSSGAYGFRDQLQDVMALIYAAPNITREHLLRSARHQFELGDVLHWWHPPSGRGIRTRFSDDLLWLPFVTAYYVNSTGDTGVLDEMIPFIHGPVLEPGEDERYGHYQPTNETFTLYEHCLRAIEKGLTSGPHELPLMGSGDWNDGMNRVGIEGRGESIWLSWFMIRTLKDFAILAEQRGHNSQAELFRNRAQELTRAVEEHGWDGEWYLRAYYDDGSPLGSRQNRECQIDAIAQSWAVLSEAGSPERVQSAMQQVLKRLVLPNERLLLLFTPPFDRTPHDPGYIKGYLPGIRENGGQYTHAAIWTVWAFASMGQGDEAGRLFRLLNPILQADRAEKLERYRVEPYVIAADIYSVPPHTGRGGWTWYTGSAGWMYRLGLEAILGLRLSWGELVIDPCIPSDWLAFEVTLRKGKSLYHIKVENPQGVSRGVREITLDGKPLSENRIRLEDDGEKHQIDVLLGS